MAPMDSLLGLGVAGSFPLTERLPELVQYNELSPWFLAFEKTATGKAITTVQLLPLLFESRSLATICFEAFHIGQRLCNRDKLCAVLRRDIRQDAIAFAGTGVFGQNHLDFIAGRSGDFHRVFR